MLGWLRRAFTALNIHSASPASVFSFRLQFSCDFFDAVGHGLPKFVFVLPAAQFLPVTRQQLKRGQTRFIFPATDTQDVSNHGGFASLLALDGLVTFLED